MRSARMDEGAVRRAKGTYTASWGALGVVLSLAVLGGCLGGDEVGALETEASGSWVQVGGGLGTHGRRASCGA